MFLTFLFFLQSKQIQQLPTKCCEGFEQVPITAGLCENYSSEEACMQVILLVRSLTEINEPILERNRE